MVPGGSWQAGRRRFPHVFSWRKAGLPPCVHCAKPRLARARGTNPRSDIRRFATCERRRGRGSWALPGRPKARLGSRMNALLQDYLPLVVFIGIALVIGLALLIAPFIVAYRQPDPEKLSAYECGFNAFDDARMKFDVRFYLVAILFIIFDLEVAFLFPWAVAFGRLGWL